MAENAGSIIENAVNYIYYNVFMKCLPKSHKLKCKLFWLSDCPKCELKSEIYELRVTKRNFFA